MELHNIRAQRSTEAFLLRSSIVGDYAAFTEVLINGLTGIHQNQWEALISLKMNLGHAQHLKNPPSKQPHLL